MSEKCEKYTTDKDELDKGKLLSLLQETLDNSDH